MPLFLLSKAHVFPPVEYADHNGLLAIGGDLSKGRLLKAYSQGIFPWYSEGSPILWWSPDPRLVLFPSEMKVSRSLRQVIRKGTFTVTFDRSFEEVVRSCAATHHERTGETWITPEMVRAYLSLHRAGYAHSVESWCEGTLSGGLYGVSLGRVFFGESMFARRSDASKVAFVSLVRRLEEKGFSIIDCQVATGHLVSLGAREISRREFLTLIREVVDVPSKAGRWDTEDASSEVVLTG